MTNDFSAEAKQLALTRKQLDIIRNVSAELNKFIGLQTKLNNILRILDEQFGITHSMILLPVQNQQALKVYASRGYPETNAMVPWGKGMVGMAAEKRIPINLTGLQRKWLYVQATMKETASDDIPLTGFKNAESQIAIPLLSNNELIAVLTAESIAPSVFSMEDEKFLLTLTTHIAISIQNSILFDSMEEKIKTRTQELEQINQTKNKLFSIISHDLRSPVTSFQSITQLLKYYISRGESAKIESLNDKIEHSVSQLNFLLDNLLNWALSQGNSISCNFEPLLLKPFLEEIKELYSELLSSKKISLFIDVPTDISILADINTLSVIFRNLLNNAIKFTSRNGTIKISAKNFNTIVQITVEDSGIGISEEKLNTLFTLLEKKSTIGTEKERGTGLGLVLVKEFIAMNKGTISVESKPGVGTTFIIQLPTSPI